MTALAQTLGQCVSITDLIINLEVYKDVHGVRSARWMQVLISSPALLTLNLAWTPVFPPRPFLAEGHIEALIVPAGWQETGRCPMLMVSPSYSVPVTGTGVRGRQRWGVRVKTGALCYTKWFVLTLWSHCSMSRVSSVIHLVLWLLEEWSHIVQHLQTCPATFSLR